MGKETPSKPVTITEFKKEIGRLDVKIDGLTARVDRLTVRVDALEAKVDRVALGLVKLDACVSRIEETMATKSDVRSILDAIDAFARKAETCDRKSVTHGAVLQEHEA